MERYQYGGSGLGGGGSVMALQVPQAAANQAMVNSGLQAFNQNPDVIDEPLVLSDRNIAVDASDNIIVWGHEEDMPTQLRKGIRFDANGNRAEFWPDGNDDYFSPFGIAANSTGGIYFSGSKQVVGATTEHRDSAGVFQNKVVSFLAGSIHTDDTKLYMLRSVGAINICSAYLLSDSSFQWSYDFLGPLPQDLTSDLGYVYIVISGGIIKLNIGSGTYNNNYGGLGPFTSVAIDSSGDLWMTMYISDFSHLLGKYSNTGTLIDTYGSDNLEHPTGIAIDSNDNVYVMDIQKRAVVKFNSSGTYVTEWTA